GQPCDGPQQCALSRTGTADDHRDVTSAHVEIDALHHLPLAEALAQAPARNEDFADVRGDLTRRVRVRGARSGRTGTSGSRLSGVRPTHDFTFTFPPGIICTASPFFLRTLLPIIRLRSILLRMSEAGNAMTKYISAATVRISRARYDSVEILFAVNIRSATAIVDTSAVSLNSEMLSERITGSC